MAKFRPKNSEYQTHDCHSSRPAMTRRDFLARTAGSSATVAFMPSVLTLLANAAHGACSGAVADKSGFPAFITVDLAGGWNGAGNNFMVGGRGGQNDFLADYSSLGITPGRSPRRGSSDDMTRTLNSPNGFKFHSDSAFFEGLYKELNPTARAKVDGTVFCARSGDDTQNNPHSPLYWIAKAQIMFGRRGELTSLVGTRGSVSGGNASAPARSVDPMLRPVQINQASDANNLVNVGLLPDWINGSGANGTASIDVQKSRVERVLAAVNRMSSAQLERFSQQDLPTQVKSLVDCGYLKSKDSVQKYMGGGDAVNAALDDRINGLLGLAGNNQNVGPNGVNRGNDATNMIRGAAGIAKLVLDGLANAGAVAFGGYDYHNTIRNTTDARDRNAGHVCGALINAAAALGKDLILYIYSDGGLSSGGIEDATNTQVLNRTTGVFETVTGLQKFQANGDNGTRSTTCILAYRHKGLRLHSKHQIGWYNASGSVERSASLISDNVENLTKAIVANYLSLAGKEGSLANVVGDNPFGGSLSDVLALQNWGG